MSQFNGSLHSLQKFALYHALVIWRTKAFWMRALLCWGIGAAVLLSDDFTKFDSRLQIRGPQKSNAEVVIVDISERDWSAMDPDSRNMLKPLKEVISLSDAFFWNQRSWEKLLRAVLADQPAAVGITFYFGENIRVQNAYSSANKAVFQDPRIVWGADVDGAGRILLPTFSTS
ncbi:MAG: CHASE2 domain-containing protein, partial [Proteobacteria bacterium]